jgi:hypothetical protein
MEEALAAEASNRPEAAQQASARAGAQAVAAAAAIVGDGGPAGLAALRRAIAALGPDRAGYFGAALAAGADGDTPAASKAKAVLGQALTAASQEAANDTPAQKQALEQLVFGVYERAGENVYRAISYFNDHSLPKVPSPVAEPMAAALAHLMRTGDAAKAETERLRRLMTDAGGYKLFTAQLGNAAATALLRRSVFYLFQARPELTAESLIEQGSPWLNQDFVRLFAVAAAPHLLQSGPAATWLDFAAAGKTKLEAAIAVSEDLGGDVRALKFTPRPFLYYNADGPVLLSRLQVDRVVDGKTARREIVDFNGDLYRPRPGQGTDDADKQWLENTRLPDGLMTDAVYGTGVTPQTVNPVHRVEEVVDTLVTDIRIVAAGFAAASPEGAALLALRILTGANVYSFGRSVQDGAEIVQHGRTLDPLTNSEARFAELSGLAAATGALGMASTLARPALAIRGLAGLRVAANRVAAGANVLAAANAGVDLGENWKKTPPEEKAVICLSLMSQVLTAGVNARGGRSAPRLPSQEDLRGEPAGSRRSMLRQEMIRTGQVDPDRFSKLNLDEQMEMAAEEMDYAGGRFPSGGQSTSPHPFYDFSSESGEPSSAYLAADKIIKGMNQRELEYALETAQGRSLAPRDLIKLNDAAPVASPELAWSPEDRQNASAGLTASYRNLLAMVPEIVQDPELINRMTPTERVTLGQTFIFRVLGDSPQGRAENYWALGRGLVPGGFRYTLRRIRDGDDIRSAEANASLSEGPLEASLQTLEAGGIHPNPRGGTFIVDAEGERVPLIKPSELIEATIRGRMVLTVTQDESGDLRVYPGGFGAVEWHRGPRERLVMATDVYPGPHILKPAKIVVYVPRQ